MATATWVRVCAVVLGVGMPHVGTAQVPARVQFDTVNMTPQLQAALDVTQGLSAWCAPLFRRDPETWNVWVDSLVQDTRSSSPDCLPREAVVLIRRECVFSTLEFVFMRARWGYVVVVCPPNAIGIPLLRIQEQRAGGSK